jgi:PAS domain-containing protein
MLFYFCHIIRKLTGGLSPISRTLGLSAERIEKMFDRFILSVFNMMRGVSIDKSRPSGKEEKEPGTDSFEDNAENMEEEFSGLAQALSSHADNFPCAVMEWGPDLRLIGWSGEAARISGLTTSNTSGRLPFGS